MKKLSLVSLLEVAKPDILEQAKKFAKMLQRKVKKHYIDDSLEYGHDKATAERIHKHSWIVSVKPGSKYIKIDVGGSGKFMLDKTNGHLYFIKGYGKVDKRKDFGEIGSIVKKGFDFDGYSIMKKGATQGGRVASMYGWAGQVAEAKGFSLPFNVKKRLNDRISDLLSPKNVTEYFRQIPLASIGKILKNDKIIMVQEDNTEWSGMLLGKDGRAKIDLAPMNTKDGEFYTPYTNTVLVLTWHKMPSGKYEVLSYVS